MAIVGGPGVCILCGVPYNSAVIAVGFIVLGLGIDDTFIIVGCYRSTRHRNGSPRHAGAAIAVTSITDIVVFALGALSKIPAVSAFCIYASVAILFDFVLQVTVFVAVVVLDTRRQAANRLDGCCCIRRQSTSDRQLCSKQQFDENAIPKTTQLVGQLLPRVLLHPIGLAVVLMTAMAVTTMGVVEVAQIKAELALEEFTPSQSPLQSTYVVRDTYFPGQVHFVGFFTGQADYFDHIGHAAEGD